MFLQKKWFEGSLAYFHRCMQHPDVAFAVVTDKRGNKYTFLKDPESRRNEFIGTQRQVPDSFGQLHLTTNRDVDESQIHYYTRDAYKYGNGLLYAPMLEGVAENTNQYYALMEKYPNLDVHLHTDNKGIKWYACRNSFSNRRIMLQTEPHPHTPMGYIGIRHCYVYGDVLDQYSGEWHFENLTPEALAAADAKRLEEKEVKSNRSFESRCTLKKTTGDDCEQVTVLKETDVEGIWDKETFSLVIDVQGLIQSDQVINLRTFLSGWAATLHDRNRRTVVSINLDNVGFQTTSGIMSGVSLQRFRPNTYFCARSKYERNYIHSSKSNFPSTSL